MMQSLRLSARRRTWCVLVSIVLHVTVYIYIYTHTTDGNCQPIIHYDVPTKRFCTEDEVLFTNGMMRTHSVVDCNSAMV